MSKRTGRNLPLSPLRKLVGDLQHYCAKVPGATVERPLSLAALRAARQACVPRPSWCAIFLKAMSIVGASASVCRRRGEGLSGASRRVPRPPEVTIRPHGRVGGRCVIVARSGVVGGCRRLCAEGGLGGRFALSAGGSVPDDLYEGPRDAAAAASDGQAWVDGMPAGPGIIIAALTGKGAIGGAGEPRSRFVRSISGHNHFLGVGRQQSGCTLGQAHP